MASGGLSLPGPRETLHFALSWCPECAFSSSTWFFLEGPAATCRPTRPPPPPTSLSVSLCPSSHSSRNSGVTSCKRVSRAESRQGHRWGEHMLLLVPPYHTWDMVQPAPLKHGHLWVKLRMIPCKPIIPTLNRDMISSGALVRLGLRTRQAGWSPDLCRSSRLKRLG